MQIGAHHSAPRRDLRTRAPQDLIAGFHHAESWSKAVLVGEVIATVVALLLAWRWSDPMLWKLGLWSFGIGFVGLFWPFVFVLGEHRKPLTELREETRFGPHSKASLLALVRRVCQRLGVPSHATGVCITNSKDKNAYAMRCEFLPGLRMFNYVRLERGILHLLDEAELESVVGHELGHMGPYAKSIDHYYLVHALCAASVALAASFYFQDSYYVWAAPVLCVSLMETLLGWLRGMSSRLVEFLCDDHGAIAAGWLPAFSSEVKLGLHAEASTALLLHVLEARRRGHPATLKELMELYEAAMPLGKIDPTATAATLNALVQTSRQQSGKFSIGGLYQHIWNSDDGMGGDEDQLDEQIQKLRLLTSLPLVPIDRDDFENPSAEWREDLAGFIACQIEAHPQALFVQAMSDATDANETHPTTSRRLLYLWRNRERFAKRRSD